MGQDLIVIGGGPGGYTAAIRAAQLGLKTTLIERDCVGGTCLNRGCIPTKTLLQSAGLYQQMQGCAAFGLSAEHISFDLAAVAQRKEKVVETLRGGVEDLLKANGVERVQGSAVIEDPGRVRVGEQQLESRFILIATGGRPALPPIPGLDLPGVVTSDAVLEHPAEYSSVVILGGGVIGMEFAALYSAFGAQVTVLEGQERLLPAMDREFGQNLALQLKQCGVRVHTGAQVTQVEQAEGGLCCHFTAKGKAETAEGDAVLVATGRRANTDGLCADGIDLKLERGAIPVNEHFETALPGVFAVGDVVSGGIQLAHVAAAQGINAVSHMAGRGPGADLRAIPACVYTGPELASVGLTLAQAKEAGIAAASAKYLMGGNGRTLIAEGGRGFIKVVYNSETGAVLGAQLMCMRATDLVGEFSAAIIAGATLEDMARVVRPHPTFAEGISEAVESGLGMAIHQINR